MDYCWGVIDLDRDYASIEEFQKYEIFNRIFKYIDGILFIKKTILLLKSVDVISKSQFEMESTRILVEDVYLSSFLTRDFINLASKYSLGVISHDSDFPFIIYESKLKAMLSKEEFERLGLPIRGKFKEYKPCDIALDNITPKLESRYKGLLGPNRSNARRVMIVSRDGDNNLLDNKICDLLKQVLDNPKMTVESLQCSVDRSPFISKFTIPENGMVNYEKNNLKRERDYIRMEPRNDFRIVRKYEGELDHYVKNEGVFRKVHFTLRKNLSNKNLPLSEVIKDLDAVRGVWDGILEGESSHYKEIEDLLINLGKIILGDISGEDDGFKVVFDGIISLDHVIKLLKLALIKAKFMDEGALFAIILVGLNQFKNPNSLICKDELCHLICQKYNGKVYLIGINVKS